MTPCPHLSVIPQATSAFGRKLPPRFAITPRPETGGRRPSGIAKYLMTLTERPGFKQNGAQRKHISIMPRNCCSPKEPASNFHRRVINRLSCFPLKGRPLGGLLTFV